MINKIILPIKTPQVTSYTSVAHLLTILETGNQANNWIYSNFINLWCEEYSPEYLSQLRYENICAIENCPSIKVRYTNSNYLSKINVDLLSAIKAAACLGLYTLCSYDEFYISYSMNYNKNHFIHQCLVYGYDESKQIFNISDFFHNNKYEYVSVEYDDFKKAIIQNHFLLLIYYRTTSMDFEKNELVNNINDFLNSTLSKTNILLQPLDKKLIKENKMKFGLDCYDLVAEYLGDLKKYPVNMRTWLHALYDHKILMINRIKYLSKMGYMNDSKGLMKKYILLSDMAQNNRNIFIKYQIVKNEELLYEIIKNIREMKNKDEEYMNCFRSLII